jgi:alkylation response protein AidB-like acyl-CoA dehydrogenase
MLAAAASPTPSTDRPMRSATPRRDAQGERGAGVERLLQSVASCVPAMKGRAPHLMALRMCGVFSAPIPLEYGGLGLGTQADGAAGLLALLRLIGSGSLAVGRIIEGHVNALQLICLYGAESQIVRAAEDSAQGHLFAIWNTETPPGGRLGEDGSLAGCKDHGSAAGSASRPLITVDQSRLLLVSLAPGERATAAEGTLHGMRATQSGWIDFDGYVPRSEDWIGKPGDYLRQPAFSAGAWRTLAVILGGIEALVDELRAQLQARRRDGNPHQAARIAQALIARETAFLWTRKAALLAECGNAAPEDITAYVNLARRAVEAAGLEVIGLAQRSLGLSAFQHGNPVERLMRDIATYLRQPAMDEALEEAAVRFVSGSVPSE